MRIAIFGAGAIGGYFGGRLVQAGEDVIFIARGQNLEALRTHGLRVDSTMGNFAIKPVNVTNNPASVGPVDVVIVAVKTWQLPGAIESMRPMVGPTTLVVSQLNGMDAPGELAAAFGTERVSPGLSKIFSTLAGPGHIVHGGGPATFRFSEPGGQPNEKARLLLAALLRAGVAAAITSDIDNELWEKFMFVTSFASVGAVTRAPMGVIRSIPETRQMLQDAMAEIRAVALAHGAQLGNDVIAQTMKFADQQPAAGTASMQRDILNGRPSELHALTGAVVRLGKKTGVATPLYTAVYHSLLPQELKARGEMQFPS